MRETLDETQSDQISDCRDDDRDRWRRLLGRKGAGRRVGHDDINIEPRQFRRQRRQPVILALGPAELDHNILAFDVAEVAQPGAKGSNARGMPGRGDKTQIPDTGDLRPLLRTRRAAATPPPAPPSSVMNSRRRIAFLRLGSTALNQHFALSEMEYCTVCAAESPSDACRHRVNRVAVA